MVRTRIKVTVDKADPLYYEKMFAISRPGMMGTYVDPALLKARIDLTAEFAREKKILTRNLQYSFDDKAYFIDLVFADENTMNEYMNHSVVTGLSEAITKAGFSIGWERL